MKASNISKCVIKVTKYKYIHIALLLVLIPVAYAGLSGSLSVDAITKRLEPMAQVNVAGVDAAAPEDAAVGVGTPKDIYKRNCEMCHATGLASAPKLGNKADWAPRISQGLDTMVKHAWEGIRAMPPKGNCLQCSEADIRATVQYMVDSLK